MTKHHYGLPQKEQINLPKNVTPSRKTNTCLPQNGLFQHGQTIFQPRKISGTKIVFFPSGDLNTFSPSRATNSGNHVFTEGPPPTPTTHIPPHHHDVCRPTLSKKATTKFPRLPQPAPVTVTQVSLVCCQNFGPHLEAWSNDILALDLGKFPPWTYKPQNGPSHGFPSASSLMVISGYLWEEHPWYM